MRPGHESQTSVWVCAGRALAHDASPGTGFSDPTALVLLPPVARADVERIRAGAPSRGFRDTMARRSAQARSQLMVARTLAIDESIRETSAPQLVILGSGLDGRAWRMPELSATTVFEVDHPDTQRAKRDRATALTSTCREIRFVPVDFTRDSLADALADAGHDASQPTTWVWEGVVMYLTAAEIDATLAVVAARSAPGSRLVIAYHRPAWFLWLVGVAVRRLGEPLKSTFTPERARDLLDRFGFHVVCDEDIPEVGRRVSPQLGAAVRHLGHMRVVTADRRPA